MSVVHASRGGSDAGVSAHLRSEVAIVCGLARSAVRRPEHPVPWAAARRRLRPDPGPHRAGGARASTTSTTGCASPAGSSCRTRRGTTRRFETATGKAQLRVNELYWLPRAAPAAAAADACVSHDQYNTTIYGLDDRYRGVKGGRRVVFCTPTTSPQVGS